MIGPLIRRIVQNLLLLIILVALSPKCLASEFMKQGMADYAAGNYGDAAGHFGGALSTDFNNATLHYYLGSCYAHMKQKEAAVREFRIAYALEPEKEVGHFAKQALELYGFEPGGPAEKKAQVEPGAFAPGGTVPAGGSVLPGFGVPTATPGAIGAPGIVSGQSSSTTEMPKPKTMLEKQAEELANLRAEQGRISSAEAAKQGDQFIQQRTRDLLDANRYVTRRGRVIQPTQLTGDYSKSIDSLKRLYDSQKSSYAENGAQQSREIQSTANSLKELMNEEQHAGKMHLSPSGTNLYVRSYEMTPTLPEKMPEKNHGAAEKAQGGAQHK